MILIFAEKPLAGERIAKILSGGKAKKKVYKKHPYWEFTWRNRKTILIPLKGHIFDVDFPKELQKWEEKTLTALIDAPLKQVTINREIVELIEKFAPKVEEVIIATDNDREGEAIGLEAAQHVLKFRNVPVYRARFSAITEKDILEAFQNLDFPDENLANAAFARREIDLLWGAVLTRAFSLLANKRGKDFLSLGRVQTPTLALVVEREREIENFVPLPYWVIEADVEFDGKKFTANYAEGQIWQEFTAKTIFERLKGATEARVFRLERREEKIPRPAPFDTTTFLKEANDVLGIPAEEAMQIAEKLYMMGLISYPRTDNQAYPPTIDLREIVKILDKIPMYKEYTQELLIQAAYRPSSGRKTKDHPPIHPVGVPGKLSEKEWKIYDLIARRFMATLFPPAILERVRIHIHISGVPFVVEGKRLIQRGWLLVYPWAKIKEVPIPRLREGQKGKVLDIRLLKKHTTPPKRFSQGELIRRMDALGLGTKSTRAEIVAKLFARKYLTGRKTIKPTERGRKLIEVISKFAPDLVTPKMTAELEEEMEKIAKGEKTKEEVVQKSKELLKKVLKEVLENRGEVQALGNA